MLWQVLFLAVIFDVYPCTGVGWFADVKRSASVAVCGGS
jgi:hypothetical protein